MYISETAFPHLAAEADARLARELERRRVIAERLAETGEHSRRLGRGTRRAWFQRSAVPAHSPLAATA
ncbi:hypothetical protein ACWGPP_17080 [Agromyces sp. NPDC055657]